MADPPRITFCRRCGVGLVSAAISVAAAGCREPSRAATVEFGAPSSRGGLSAVEDRVASTAPDPADLDVTAGLDEYLKYAMRHNTGLEAAFNRWQAAVQRVPQVQSLPDPRLSYRYFIDEVETRVGPQEWAVGLSQTFPWFGELDLRGDAAAAAAAAERQRFEAARLALVHEVTDAYSEYYYLGRSIDVVQTNLSLVEYLESVARARYKTAAASHPDVIRAQVELGRLEDQIAALRDLRGAVMARLIAALNRPAQDELPFPSGIPDERMTLPDASVLALLEQHNPELTALDHAVEQAGFEVELARKNYYPDVTVGADYTEVGGPARAAAGAVGSDAGQDIRMVSLAINLPIWRENYSAGEREARARRAATSNRRRQYEADLSARLKRVLYEYRDAGRKITLYRDTLIPKARESIESTETAFRAGSAAFLDLVDAERTLLDFELAYERALADRSSRLAELDRLVGLKLPRGTGD